MTARENSSLGTYNWLDVNPEPGIYYYRVKANSSFGAVGYSEMVKVKIVKIKSQLYVYPNPVTDGVIGSQMNNLPAGNYSTRLLTASGQVVLSKNIVHDNGKSTETITCPTYLTTGTYQLEVVGRDKKKSTLTVVISSK